jgi:hypothetical protein
MAKAQPHPDYDVSDNTYNLKRQNVKDEMWDTEVGDRRNVNKFVPRIKYQRFEDGFLEIGVPNGLHGGGDSVTHEGNTIVWQRQIYTARFYDFENDPEDTQGGGSYEWEIVLASVPPANSLTLDLRRQNVVLYYQGELTQEEIDNGAERPDRVVGSYAIYHNTKRHHKPGEPNYQVGKIGHLYRPLCTDDNGDTIWGEWNDDAEIADELTLTIDATWLANAAYPVTIDPTFGYTTAGGSASADTNGECGGFTNASGLTYTASAGDTVTKFSINGYALSGTPACNVAVYDVDGSGDPQTRLAAGTSVTLTSGAPAAWYHSAAVSQSLSASTEYTVCTDDATPQFRFAYDVATTGDRSKDSASGGTLPATWTHDRDVSAVTSVYATYTTGGAPTRRVMVVS